MSLYLCVPSLEIDSKVQYSNIGIRKGALKIFKNFKWITLANCWFFILDFWAPIRIKSNKTSITSVGSERQIWLILTFPLQKHAMLWQPVAECRTFARNSNCLERCQRLCDVHTELPLPFAFTDLFRFRWLHKLWRWTVRLWLIIQKPPAAHCNDYKIRLLIESLYAKTKCTCEKKKNAKLLQNRINMISNGIISDRLDYWTCFW